MYLGLKPLDVVAHEVWGDASDNNVRRLRTLIRTGQLRAKMVAQQYWTTDPWIAECFLGMPAEPTPAAPEPVPPPPRRGRGRPRKYLITAAAAASPAAAERAVRPEGPVDPEQRS